MRGDAQGAPWGDVIVTSIAAVGWAVAGMAGVAASALRLLDMDAVAPLGPPTAAVVALSAGGSVTSSAEVSALGARGGTSELVAGVLPLGVGLVGALLLSAVFLRGLRGAGAFVAGRELAARTGGVVVLFAAAAGGLARVGRDTAVVDGAWPVPGHPAAPGGGEPGGIRVPGLGEIGGLWPDGIADVVAPKVTVAFAVDLDRSVAGAALWALAVLVVALVAAPGAPLPPGRGWDAVRRVVRPAVSAMVVVLLVVAASGYAVAGYAAVGAERPGRVLGAALLGAPNGAWAGLSLGLFVPWEGRASGALAGLVPDPLGALLRASAHEPVTLEGLAALDGRVWPGAVALGAVMLGGGVLAAARTPRAGLGAVAFAGRCAVRSAAVWAVALPLLGRPAEVSADASVSVLRHEVFDAELLLRGDAWRAGLLGLVWGAAYGAAGALTAYATHLAGRWTALPGVVVGDDWYGEGAAHGSGAADAAGPRPTAGDATGPDGGNSGDGGDSGAGAESGARVGRSAGADGGPGPYRPSESYRPPNPDTNPYLRPPDGGAGAGIHEAPTVSRPVRPPELPPEGPPPPGRPGEGRQR
ncbi:streptophobe family protein [Streptomyces sp. TRM49041]|uniref:streptophobe family protein n=1 Tax=Streptomyces sp. TRM49041 TaxID=2603216 RepID=UPI001CA3DBD7|nr:streptophobe family protein [Streptomyces sp. TRM49041]